MPPHLLERFARRSDAAPLANRPIGGGQIHLLARRPGFGAVLLDAWQPALGQWRGWLVTPDAAYADACGLVVEERDAPADPRAGLVLCDMPVTLAVADLGACLGVFSQDRLQAARWIELHGRDNAAAAAPGVVARVALPDGYALTGTPLGMAAKDSRNAYRQLLREGLQQLQIAPATPATGTAIPTIPAIPVLPAAPVKAANASRWLKMATAVAASVMVAQSVWIFLPRQAAIVDNADIVAAAAASRPACASACCSAPTPPRRKSAPGCSASSSTLSAAPTPWARLPCSRATARKCCRRQVRAIRWP